MLDFLASLCWNTLSLTPKPLKNALYDQIFPTAQALETLLLGSAIILAPGLLDALTAESPPPMSFFKNLPTEVPKNWAIYLLVLEKQGCRSKIYIGSGTEKRDGISRRFAQYKRGECGPAFVRPALEQGFTITHYGLLCWAPIPPGHVIPPSRALFLIIETSFAVWFWSIVSRTKDYGMRHLCPWNIDDMEYGGCCNHFSLQEGGIRIGIALTPEQAETAESERKRQARSRRVSGKERTLRYGKGVKKNREKNIALKRWVFHVCQITCGTSQELKVHNATRRHLDKVSGTPERVWKDACAKPRHEINIAMKRYYC